MTIHKKIIGSALFIAYLVAIVGLMLYIRPNASSMGTLESKPIPDLSNDRRVDDEVIQSVDRASENDLLISGILALDDAGISFQLPRGWAAKEVELDSSTSGVRMIAVGNPDELQEARSTDWWGCGIYMQSSFGAKTFSEWFERYHAASKPLSATTILRGEPMMTKEKTNEGCYESKAK